MGGEERQLHLWVTPIIVNTVNKWLKLTGPKREQGFCHHGVEILGEVGHLVSAAHSLGSSTIVVPIFNNNLSDPLGSFVPFETKLVSLYLKPLSSSLYIKPHRTWL